MLKRVVLGMAVMVLLLGVKVAYGQGGTIAVGDTLEGMLNNSTAEYTFTARGGESVTFTLRSDDFDPFLELRDGDGVTLLTDDDSGGDLNAALMYTFSAAGTYRVVVTSYSGPATGAYTLSAAAFEIVTLSYGVPAKVKVNNDVHNFTFTAEAGTVIDLACDNPDLDVRLTLVDAGGMQVAYDDDGGPGYAPYLRRVILQDGGQYTVRLEPVGSDVVGTTLCTLTQTEVQSLDGGPVTVTLSSDMSMERLVFTATAGQTYRLTVSSPSQTDAYITVMQEGYEVYSLNFSQALEGSFVFMVSSGGLLPVEVTSYSTWSGPVTLEITVEPVAP